MQYRTAGKNVNSAASECPSLNPGSTTNYESVGKFLIFVAPFFHL